MIVTDKDKISQVCEPCKSVEEGEEIGAELLKELTESKSGIGLAANQIGVLKQIVVVNIQDKEKAIEKTYALFNPVIKNYSKKKVIIEEGCLSLPQQFADIERPESITICYTNEKNKIVEEKKDGQEAIIIQHEIDHLSGKLFVDYLSSLKRNILIKKVTKLKKMGEI